MNSGEDPNDVKTNRRQNIEIDDAKSLREMQEAAKKYYMPSEEALKNSEENLEEDKFTPSIIDMATGGAFSRRELAKMDANQVSRKTFKTPKILKKALHGKKLHGRSKVLRSLPKVLGPVESAKALANFIIRQQNPASRMLDIEEAKQRYLEMQAIRGNTVTEQSRDIIKQRENLFQLLKLFKDDYQRKVLKSINLNNIENVNAALLQIKKDLDNPEVTTQADLPSHFKTIIGASATDIETMFKDSMTPQQWESFPDLFYQIKEDINNRVSMMEFFTFVGSNYSVENRDNKIDNNTYRELRFISSSEKSYNWNKIFSEYLGVTVNVYWDNYTPNPFIHVVDNGDWVIEIMDSKAKNEERMRQKLINMAEEFAEKKGDAALYDSSITKKELSKLSETYADLETEAEDLRDQIDDLEDQKKLIYNVIQNADGTEELRLRTDVPMDAGENWESEMKLLNKRLDRVHMLQKDLIQLVPRAKKSKGKGFASNDLDANILKQIRKDHGRQYYKLKQFIHNMQSPMGIALANVVRMSEKKI